MKYAIFGLGGVGSVVADQLVQGGKDVAGIARGTHLEALRAQGGLRVDDGAGETRFVAMPVYAADEYDQRPDVVFVCVKDYSLESSYPFLERVCTPSTVVVPLSNVYGTGERIAKQLHSALGDQAPLVTCGCIYCSGTIQEPGMLYKNSSLCRVLMGMPDADEQREYLVRMTQVAKDASTGSLTCTVVKDIRREHLRKFSYMASASAVGIIFGCTSDEIKGLPLVNVAFQDAIREIVRTAAAQNIPLGEDILQQDLNILAQTAPASTTSLQRDLLAGRPSEIEGIIRSVVAWGVAFGVPTPVFSRASVAAREQYGV